LQLLRAVEEGLHAGSGEIISPAFLAMVSRFLSDLLPLPASAPASAASGGLGPLPLLLWGAARTYVSDGLLQGAEASREALDGLVEEGVERVRGAVAALVEGSSVARHSFEAFFRARMRGLLQILASGDPADFQPFLESTARELLALCRRFLPPCEERRGEAVALAAGRLLAGQGGDATALVQAAGRASTALTALMDEGPGVTAETTAARFVVTQAEAERLDNEEASSPPEQEGGDWALPAPSEPPMSAYIMSVPNLLQGTVPAEWADVIARDAARPVPAPTPPSDAYLLGRPVKRRRVGAAPPRGVAGAVLTDVLRASMSSVSSAAAARVMADASLRQPAAASAFGRHVRRVLRQRTAANADLRHDRFSDLRRGL